MNLFSSLVLFQREVEFILKKNVINHILIEYITHSFTQYSLSQLQLLGDYRGKPN